MNFLCIGTVFLLFQLNFGWTSNYIVKLIGFVLFLVGTGELGDLCRAQDNPGKKLALAGFNVSKQMEELFKNSVSGESCAGFCETRLAVLELIRKQVVMSAGMCLAAAVCRFVLGLLELNALLDNLLSAVLGAAVTVMALSLFELVLRFCELNEKYSQTNRCRFLNDISSIYRLRAAYNKTAVVTLICLGCDILNRFIPVEFISGAAGLGLAVGKVILYCMIVFTVYHFNNVRTDCNRKYDKENNTGAV